MNETDPQQRHEINTQAIRHAIANGTMTPYQEEAIVSYIRWLEDFKAEVDKAGGPDKTLYNLPKVPEESEKLISSVGSEGMQELAQAYKDKQEKEKDQIPSNS